MSPPAAPSNLLKEKEPMINLFQKTISMILIGLVFISHTGCGNKVLTTPLNRAQFSSDYSYNIKTTQGGELPNLNGSQIENLPDRLHITQNNETKFLLHNQVQTIEGTSNQSNGTHILEGMGIGLGAGALVGSILFSTVIYNNDCFLDEGEDFCSRELYALGGILFGALGGGVLGLGTGAAIPKKQKIHIIPIITPTSTSVGGGANVQIKF
ncbi:MAG: hypothetical protein R2877_05685 [Bdellovibrionota bacterium]